MARGVAGKPLAWRLGQQRWARTPVSGVLGLNTELDQFEDETGGEESEILIWGNFQAVGSGKVLKSRHRGIRAYSTGNNHSLLWADEDTVERGK